MSPQPDVLSLLKDIAKRSASIVDKIGRRSDIFNLDRELGRLYLDAVSLQPHSEDLPSASFANEMEVTFDWLRRSLLTAFAKHPLYDDERGFWVSELDRISAGAHRMALAYEAVDRKEEAYANAREGERRLRAEVRAAGKSGGLHDQLQIIAEKMRADGAAPGGDAEFTAAELEERKARRRKFLEEAWYEAENGKIDDAARFPVALLQGTSPKYAVTSYPVILAKYRFDERKAELLSEAGIKLARVFGHYLQIHNCRLFGVRSDLLPGNLRYGRRLAQELFLKLAKKEPAYRSYRFSGAPARHFGSFTYFILLPKKALTVLEVSQWDWSKPPAQMKVIEQAVEGKTSSGAPEFGATHGSCSGEGPEHHSFSGLQWVNITSGPWRGRAAQILSINGKNVRVAATVFGREKMLEVSVGELEPRSAASA